MSNRNAAIAAIAAIFMKLFFEQKDISIGTLYKNTCNTCKYLQDEPRKF